MFLRARQAWESIKSLAQLPKKLMSGGGGDSHPFFFPDNFQTSVTLLGRGTLGTQHRPPGWQATKKKKKKKNTWNLGGDYPPHLKFRGGHVPPVPPASAASADWDIDTRAATLNNFHFPLPRMLISTYVSPTPIDQVFTHKVNGKGAHAACAACARVCALPYVACYMVFYDASREATRAFLMLIWVISSIFTHHCSFRAL